MYTQSVVIVALVAFAGVLVASNPYGAPTYNDAYEQPAYPAAPAPAYQQQASYGHQSYQAPAPAYHAPAPAYHAPAYPKYQAPSSAHHTQYDNYYPKQTYSQPKYEMPKYEAPKPMYSPPAYQAPQQYAKPAYQAPSYGGHEEY